MTNSQRPVQQVVYSHKGIPSKESNAQNFRPQPSKSINMRIITADVPPLNTPVSTISPGTQLIIADLVNKAVVRLLVSETRVMEYLCNTTSVLFMNLSWSAAIFEVAPPYVHSFGQCALLAVERLNNLSSYPVPLNSQVADFHVEAISTIKG